MFQIFRLRLIYCIRPYWYSNATIHLQSNTPKSYTNMHIKSRVSTLTYVSLQAQSYQPLTLSHHHLYANYFHRQVIDVPLYVEDTSPHSIIRFCLGPVYTCTESFIGHNAKTAELLMPPAVLLVATNSKCKTFSAHPLGEYTGMVILDVGLDAR